MAPDARQGFTDTITSLAAARKLAPDDSGKMRRPTGPTFVTLEVYERDMSDILKGLTLLKQFQDRTAWTLKVLAVLFGGACTLATVVAAFHHG